MFLFDKFLSWKSLLFCFSHLRPCGLMDKAPDFGSGDCRFESCHGRKYKIFVWLNLKLWFHYDEGKKFDSGGIRTHALSDWCLKPAP